MPKQGPRGRVREYQAKQEATSVCSLLGSSAKERRGVTILRVDHQNSVQKESATSGFDARRWKRDLSSLMVKGVDIGSWLAETGVSGIQKTEGQQTYNLSTLSVRLQFLATGEDSYDPARLRNHVHHGFHSGWTFHKTFPTTEYRRGSTVPVFTMSLVGRVFPVPEWAVGVFMFPVAMCILVQRTDFQNIQSSTGSPISGERTSGAGLELVDMRCREGDW